MTEKVRIGGLMRCCLATLGENREHPPAPAQEGDYLECRYCKSEMVFRDGAWEWKDTPVKMAAR